VLPTEYRSSELYVNGNTDMAIEYDKWLYVKADSADDARRFFGVPPDWPTEFDRFEDDSERPKGRIFRVLSEAWLRQQNAHKEK
jgi:hypothetical protein